MTIQNYLIIENNVVTNIVLWDGNPQTWTPPSDSIQLVQSTTPDMVWVYNKSNSDWELTQEIGTGNIGFTWNGNVLTTNQPKPSTPIQPVSSGTKTI